MMRRINGRFIITVPAISQKRTWLERLWSWPWCPWQKEKFGPMLQDGEVLKVGDYSIYMNEVTRRDLETRVRSGHGISRPDIEDW